MSKPKTVEDVLALPELKEHDEVLCPNCHHTISVRRPARLQLRGTEPDDIVAVAGPDGNWQPVQVDGVWYRRRLP